jgi:hypothetical protein
MTVNSRRRYYQAFSIFCSLLLLVSLFLLFDSSKDKLTDTRFLIHDSLTMLSFISGITAVMFCVLAGALCNTVVSLSIGKSISVEIFFCALWALGMSLESGRLLVLWLSRQQADLTILSLISRIVLFGRYLSLGALFMASVFAVGFKHERLNPAISVVFFCALLFSSIQPLNTGILDQDFIMQRGFRGLTLSFEIAVIIISLANYVIAWKNSGSIDFLFIGLASLGLFFSMFILRNSMHLVLTLSAGGIMAIAIWQYLKRVYNYYLWR